MPTFRTIGGQEPSTISFSLDVVQIARNGSNVVREIQVIGDPDSSQANAAVLGATPASTAWGLVVRPLFSSTGADNPVSVSNYSTIVSVANQVKVVNSTAADFVMRPVFSSTGADNPVSVSNQVRVSNSTATDLLVRPILPSSQADNPVEIGLTASTGLSTLGVHAAHIKAQADVYGRQFVRTGGQAPAPLLWSVNASPGASTFATITKSSAAGVRQVVTGFSATVAVTSSNSTLFNSTVVLIDGAAGGSTFLWRSVVSLTAGMASFNFANLWFAGAVAGPVTLEFQTSGGANVVQSVTMWGQTLAE